MKKLYILIILLTVLTHVKAQNHYNYEPARWFVGSGSDTAYLVIDFQSANSYDPPSSFIYGVTFDDSISGLNLLNLVASNDPNLTISYDGIFVDSIALGNYNGKNADNGFYWGIWSDTISSNRWYSNDGTGEIIHPNEFYGLSYTDYSPAIVPDTAVAVNNTTAYTISDIEYFIGTGSDTAVLVVDFLDGNSYAWGYLFDGLTTGYDMLNDIAANDDSLTIAATTSFLNDITYSGIEGLAGAPNYWNTWSSINNGIWYANVGLSQAVNPGDWFGCSYTSWPPAIFPTTPNSAINPASVSVDEKSLLKSISIYPNPSNSIISFNTKIEKANLNIYNLTGQSVISYEFNNGLETVNVSELPNGVYTIVVSDNKNIYTTKLIKN